MSLKTWKICICVLFILGIVMIFYNVFNDTFDKIASSFKTPDLPTIKDIEVADKYKNDNVWRKAWSRGEYTTKNGTLVYAGYSYFDHEAAVVQDYNEIDNAKLASSSDISYEYYLSKIKEADYSSRESLKLIVKLTNNSDCYAAIEKSILKLNDEDYLEYTDSFCIQPKGYFYILFDMPDKSLTLDEIESNYILSFEMYDKEKNKSFSFSDLKRAMLNNLNGNFEVSYEMNEDSIDMTVTNNNEEVISSYDIELVFYKDNKPVFIIRDGKDSFLSNADLRFGEQSKTTVKTTYGYLYYGDNTIEFDNVELIPAKVVVAKRVELRG